MAEMYQAWVKGHPPPSYPANPAFVPPQAQSQEPPTVDSSPGFPIYHHYQGTTSQTPQTPPPKPIPYPPPPTTPVFVSPPPAALHRSSIEPLFQTQDNQYYPPEPTFKAPEHYSYTPHFDLPVETEKPPKNPEQEEMFRKMPKFDLYDGHGNPVAHLRGFCSKMRGAGGKDELLMAYFSQSLSGATLDGTLVKITADGIPGIIWPKHSLVISNTTLRLFQIVCL
ncbi:PREDICTED: extensin-1-like [Nicotiana attenuata]|uniref:extensin-1-like n=1 Tax=Nicotiana attenuata TaxID=49451 RepID=UPI0009050D6E|nr:PREDICTED: extensin-1-like [Nicotiana attenuata]